MRREICLWLTLSEPALDQWKAKCRHFPEWLAHQKTFPAIVTTQQQQICSPSCQSSFCSHINTHQMPVFLCMLHTLHKIKNHHKALRPNMEDLKLCSSDFPPDFGTDLQYSGEQTFIHSSRISVQERTELPHHQTLKS